MAKQIVSVSISADLVARMRQYRREKAATEETFNLSAFVSHLLFQFLEREANRAKKEAAR